ncbi:MAG: hypothetical protein ACYTFI_09050 [Planctomycetota bacterium]|jgi:hypothetical protein
MPKALDAIMAVLDPRAMAEKIDRPHDDALFAYRGPAGVPKDFGEFRERLRNYYEYHYKATIGKNYDAPVEITMGAAVDAVESTFGNRGGVEGAFANAVIGTDHGMHGSREAIAHFLKETHRKYYVRWVIDTYIDPLDFDQKVAVVRSLLKRYASPGDTFVQKKPEELAVDYKALIVELVKRLKTFVPTYYRVK